MANLATILVVEDTPANIKLVTMLLEKTGYRVLQADNAEDGIALAREHVPDLILMDIQLSGTDGLTAIRILKQDGKTRHIKMIALTAYAMKGDDRRMIESGCDGYIAKPIRYQSFLEEVKRLLALRQSDGG
jgi:two-component system cell cycle response regulator DivK